MIIHSSYSYFVLYVSNAMIQKNVSMAVDITNQILVY